MKRIPLTQGQFAIVDDKDFVRLNKFKWHAKWEGDIQSFYAARNEPGPDGKRRTVRMHREITGAKQRENVDHKNHDTLDNRRSNLRVCTNQQNLANQGLRTTNTSGFKGVDWHNANKKWRAQVRDGHGKSIFAGYFQTPIDAAVAYDKSTLRINGEFALTNQRLGLL